MYLGAVDTHTTMPSPTAEHKQQVAAVQRIQRAAHKMNEPPARSSSTKRTAKAAATASSSPPYVTMKKKSKAGPSPPHHTSLSARRREDNRSSTMPLPQPPSDATNSSSSSNSSSSNPAAAAATEHLKIMNVVTPQRNAGALPSRTRSAVPPPTTTYGPAGALSVVASSSWSAGEGTTTTTTTTPSTTRQSRAAAATAATTTATIRTMSTNTTTTRNHVSQPSKAVAKYWDQGGFVHDNDVWVERTYVSQRSGRVVTFYVSLRHPDRPCRHEPPTGAQRIVYEHEVAHLLSPALLPAVAAAAVLTAQPRQAIITPPAAWHHLPQPAGSAPLPRSWRTRQQQQHGRRRRRQGRDKDDASSVFTIHTNREDVMEEQQPVPFYRERTEL